MSSTSKMSLAEAFAGVDVVISTLPTSVPVEVRRRVAQSAVKSGAKVFFLSEFGVDHGRNDLPGVGHHQWVVRRQLASEAREVARGTPAPVIALYPKLFLKVALNPPMGFDVENNTFDCIGSPAQRVAFTSRTGVGRALARMSALALEPLTAGKVPDEVRIAGTTISFEEVRDAVAQAMGLQNGEVREDLAEAKARLREDRDTRVVQYIRVLMGEGKLVGRQRERLGQPGRRVLGVADGGGTAA
ncbi:hypothetical protein BD413DRAFT_608590 [Trametes elegans]|nr:hypothetical protein BD413DRAFT_608590 [Trametes elegans]